MIKYINSWKLKKWQVSLLYKIIGYFWKTPIQKGDKIKCWGIGYPHWKGEEFVCTAVFSDNTIGIRNAVRVSARDFYVIK